MLAIIPAVDAINSTFSTCLCSGSVKCSSCKQSVIKEYEANRKREYRKRVKEREARINQVRFNEFKRRKITTQVIKCFTRCTEGLDNEAKGEIISSILKHRALRGLKIQSTGAEVSNDEQKVLISGMHNTLKAMKRPKSLKELFIKRASIMMVMSSTSRKPNIAAASRLLGIHRRNFYAARSRLEHNHTQLPLHLCERQPYTNSVITEEVKAIVVTFWTQNTRVSPNKKDVCRKRIARKVFEKHPVHLLEQPQVCCDFLSSKKFIFIVIAPL